MRMNSQTGRGASWSVVILLLFVFFPVGIYLLVRKVTLEIDSYVKNGVVMQTLGGVLLALGLMYTFLGLTGALVDENGNSATAVVLGICVFGLGGMALLIQGVRFWRRGKKYSRYLTLIGMQHLRSLTAIAEAYPAAYETVCRDLQGMLDRGFFRYGYLDLVRRELILPEYINGQAVIPQTLRCGSCGAWSRGTTCEYCGASLLPGGRIHGR